MYVILTCILTVEPSLVIIEVVLVVIAIQEYNIVNRILKVVC